MGDHEIKSLYLLLDEMDTNIWFCFILRITWADFFDFVVDFKKGTNCPPFVFWF